MESMEYEDMDEKFEPILDIRIGVGIGLGMCLGIGIGVELLTRTYQATTKTLRRWLF